MKPERGLTGLNELEENDFPTWGVSKCPNRWRNIRLEKMGWNVHSHEQKNSGHLIYQITWQWHNNYDILIFSVILFLWVLVYFINLYWGWFSYWVYHGFTTWLFDCSIATQSLFDHRLDGQPHTWPGQVPQTPSIASRQWPDRYWGPLWPRAMRKILGDKRLDFS